MATSSALFTPYRTLGLVCDGQQQCLQQLGSETFLTTSIGRAFQVYNCRHLGLAIVSQPIPETITHVAASRDVTYTAVTGGIVVWRRARPVGTIRWTSVAANAAASDVCAMLAIADLLVAAHADGAIRVWRVSVDGDAASCEAVLQQEVVLPGGAVPTVLVHPDTYLNKVAVGTTAGCVCIVNVRSGRVVYECRVALGTPVTALAQSPALDVLGVGLADGRVLLHNVRTDAAVAAFAHAPADARLGMGRVTAVAFAFDSGLAAPTMASATDGGALALWRLDDRALVALLPAAHDGAVTHASFLPRAAALLTAGADNAVRVWQLDKLGGPPSLLRSRSGHRAPPTLARFYGGASVTSLASGADASGCEVVSAGADRSLRLVHAALDRQNCELSQGPLASRAAEMGVHPNSLRLPPVTALAASDRRHARWADVVTAHAGEPRAYLWSWDAKRLEDRVLQMPDATETVTAVCISSCGHFAVCGGAGGSVVKFNLQSAARRGSFPRHAAGGGGAEKMTARGAKRPRRQYEAGPLPPPDRDVGKGRPGGGAPPAAVDSIDTALAKIAGVVRPAPPPRGAARAAAAADPASAAGHACAVQGLAVDDVNGTLVSLDASGLVLFWDFERHALRGRAHMPCGATALVLQRDSNLAAIVCDDFVVRVIDVAARRLVRRLAGHSNRVSDVAFSPDGRWLATASLDRSLRVWDLPTGRCVDWLAFDAAPTTLAFSPTGEYLATAHVGAVGLSLWASRAHFGGVVLEDAAPAEPCAMDLPAPRAGGGDEGAGGGELRDGGAAEAAAGEVAAEQWRAGSGGGAEAAPPPPPPAPHELPSPKAGCRVTLSGLPASAWVNLSKLDLIAQRNKPAQPPSKPASAPFFLPTAAGLHPSFVVGAGAAPSAAGSDDAGEDVAVGGSSSRLVRRGGQGGGSAVTHQSPVADALRAVTAAVDAAAVAAAVDAVSDLLASLPPGAVDGELRSLCAGPEDDEGVALLGAALAYLEAELAAGARRFELAHAHLNLLLVAHQGTIAAAPALAAHCGRLAAVARGDVARLQGLLDRALSAVLGFLDAA